MRSSGFSIRVFINGFIVPLFASAIQWDTDRPGSDFSNFNLPKANPRLCQQECLVNPQCKP